MTVGGTVIEALVDTGATISLIRPDQLPPGTRVEPTTSLMKTISGDIEPMKGRCTVELCVGGRSAPVELWVADIADKCVLVFDFLKENIQLNGTAPIHCSLKTGARWSFTNRTQHRVSLTVRAT